MSSKRRVMLAALVAAGVATALVGAYAVPEASAQVPAMPKSPVTINVVDVAGDLALTQDAIELYGKKNPKRVSKFTFTKAPAPELPGKLKAMQGAGRSDIDLVLTGIDFLAAGIEQGLLVKLLPEYAAKFPRPDEQLPAGRRKDAGAGAGSGHCGGVHAGRAADRVQPGQGQAGRRRRRRNCSPGARPIRTASSTRGRPIPARAAPSSWGCRTFSATRTRRIPVNGWDKTWAYLKELNSCIEYYPTGTGAVMKELGEGSRDMTVTMTGWDINPRVLGIVPKDFKVTPFKGMTWVNDAHYMVIPKGVPPEKIAVLLDLMAFLLTPEAQAYTYDKGYFYPGPAVKNVPLSMAPKESQDALKEFGRPEYEDWLAAIPAHAVAGTQGAGRGLPHLGSADRRAEDQVTRQVRTWRQAPARAQARRRFCRH